MNDVVSKTCTSHYKEHTTRGYFWKTPQSNRNEGSIWTGRTSTSLLTPPRFNQEKQTYYRLKHIVPSDFSAPNGLRMLCILFWVRTLLLLSPFLVSPKAWVKVLWWQTKLHVPHCSDVHGIELSWPVLCHRDEYAVQYLVVVYNRAF